MFRVRGILRWVYVCWQLAQKRVRVQLSSDYIGGWGMDKVGCVSLSSHLQSALIMYLIQWSQMGMGHYLT